MSISKELNGLNSIFLDTAPIIYYIEAHKTYGPLMQDVIKCLNSNSLITFTSVITLTEVLPKPVSQNHVLLIDKFLGFLKEEANVHLLEISPDIAEAAGRLRGKYASLKTMDAIQISAAINAGADAFVTNDIKLKQIYETKVIVLNDYLSI